MMPEIGDPEALAEAVADAFRCRTMMGLGETTLAGAGRFDKPRWEWPER